MEELVMRIVDIVEMTREKHPSDWQFLPPAAIDTAQIFEPGERELLKILNGVKAPKTALWEVMASLGWKKESEERLVITTRWLRVWLIRNDYHPYRPLCLHAFNWTDFFADSSCHEPKPDLDRFLEVELQNSVLQKEAEILKRNTHLRKTYD